MTQAEHIMDAPGHGIARQATFPAAVCQVCHTGYSILRIAVATLLLLGLTACADPPPDETGACDCFADEVCFGGECQARCTSGSCPAGQACQGGVCQNEGPCSSDDDCIDFETGTRGACIEGGCYSLECDDGDTQGCETACGRGNEVCRDGVWRGCDAPPPRTEVCGDDTDNDCDGDTDENCGGCTSGDERDCETECGTGTERCVNASWRGCSAARPLQFEVCGDSVDNDCNGTIDDGCDGWENGEQRECRTECGTGTERCVDETFTGCDAAVPSDEVCDGEDNDCDGQTDEEITRDCSNACGRGTETCDDGDWDGCTARTDCSCTEGETDEQICGQCGVQRRECDDRAWSPYGECEEGGNCIPGEIEERRCGNCGTDRRICTAECLWGDWQGCLAEGTCEAGESETQTCGDCDGQHTRRCADNCEWEEFGECKVPDEAECSPGQEETRDLGQCGVEVRVCEDSCGWGFWREQTPRGVCEPGEDDARSCGNCSAEVRTCRNDCTWGDFGVCSGGGLCEPGENDVQDCGNCGTRSRRCNNDCIWDGFGACSGEGSCEPGDSEERSCGTSNVGECELGTQFRTCDNSCDWSGYSACRGNVEPSFDSCGNGEDEDCDGEDAGNPDQYEDNDDCNDAHNLGTDPDTTIAANIDTAADRDDYFYFTAEDSASPFREFITLELSDVPADADYDLYLYEGLTNCRNGDPLAVSDEGQGEDESISWGERFNFDDGGRFYVRIRRFFGNACFEPYSLRVDGLD
jgi:hypothetical protein